MQSGQDQEMGKSKKSISLFSGLGGMDYGIEAAGFSTVFATDMDPDCCDTLTANRTWHVECADVHELTGRKIFQFGDLDKGECSLMVGGPPCQPFSKSGYGAETFPQGFNDHRADTLSQFFRLVKEVRPQAFMLENVPQLVSAKNPELVKRLSKLIAAVNLLARAKYKLNIVKINCADFGVPQIRQRVFIVASVDGKDFQMPKPLFGETKIPRLGILKYRTSWDAIHKIKPTKLEVKTLRISGRWAELLKTIPPGGNYLWHTRRGGGKPVFKWRSRFWHFLLKLHPELPSWTIAAQPGSNIGPLHWNNRRLSVGELCALQTLPADLIIHGSARSVRKQIGNAVPSAMAEIMAIEIQKQFLSVRRKKTPQLVPSIAARRPEKQLRLQF